MWHGRCFGFSAGRATREICISTWRGGSGEGCAPQRDMGYPISTVSKSNLHSRYSSGSSGAASVSSGSFNRSSLAVELEEPPQEAVQEWRPIPRLVPRPAAVQVDDVPFKGLDLKSIKGDRTSKVVSAILHIEIAALVVWLGFQVKPAAIIQPAVVTHIDISKYLPPPPPKVMPVAPRMGGGGGGGAHQVAPPIKGHPPVVVAKMPVLAPQVLRIDHPKLAMEPAEMVRMPDNSKLPNLGMAQSTQVALASQGSGSGSGFGSGLGGGIGVGHGIGAGPGSGGGYGGGIMSVGGGVSAPVVVHSVEPEFTAQARESNFQGSVSIQLIVDSQGNPQNVHLVRRAGMGLDERAIEAVRQYKFRPAMYQGHPVAVQIVIDVDFHLH